MNEWLYFKSILPVGYRQSSGNHAQTSCHWGQSTGSHAQYLRNQNDIFINLPINGSGFSKENKNNLQWIRHPVLKILLLIMQTTTCKLVFSFSILIWDFYKNADCHLTVLNNPGSSLLMASPNENKLISYLSTYEGEKNKAKILK